MDPIATTEAAPASLPYKELPVSKSNGGLGKTTSGSLFKVIVEDQTKVIVTEYSPVKELHLVSDDENQLKMVTMHAISEKENEVNIRVYVANEMLDGPGQNIVCSEPGCDKSLKNSSWIKHFKSHLPADSKEVKTIRFICSDNECVKDGGKRFSFSFFTIQGLRQHYRKCHAIRPFQCMSCAKSFAIESFLKIHQGGCGIQFECKGCPKKFDSLETLRTHARRLSHEVDIQHYKDLIRERRSTESNAHPENSDQPSDKSDDVSNMEPPISNKLDFTNSHKNRPERKNTESQNTMDDHEAESPIEIDLTSGEKDDDALVMSVDTDAPVIVKEIIKPKKSDREPHFLPILPKLPCLQGPFKNNPGQTENSSILRHSGTQTLPSILLRHISTSRHCQTDNKVTRNISTTTTFQLVQGQNAAKKRKASAQTQTKKLKVSTETQTPVVTKRNISDRSLQLSSTTTQTTSPVKDLTQHMTSTAPAPADDVVFLPKSILSMLNENIMYEVDTETQTDPNPFFGYPSSVSEDHNVLSDVEDGELDGEGPKTIETQTSPRRRVPSDWGRKQLAENYSYAINFEFGLGTDPTKGDADVVMSPTRSNSPLVQDLEKLGGDYFETTESETQTNFNLFG